MLELPLSPVEQGSSQANVTYTFDLSTFLAGGTINALAVKVWGGPFSVGDYNWTDLTTALTATVSVSGNNAVVKIANALIAGYGYRVELTWQSAASNGQTLERFFIIRCLY